MRLVVLIGFLNLAITCFSQKPHFSDSIQDPSLWQLTYQSFSEALGVKPTNFQLIMPFISWNWTAEAPGQTSRQEYDFLNTMPIWSSTGHYQTGSSFSDAYNTFLDILVFKKDTALENLSQNEKEAVDQSIDCYISILQKAKQTYDSHPHAESFERWLQNPYGAGWKYQKQLQLAEIDTMQRLKIYRTYLNQLLDSALLKSRSQYENKQFYTLIYNLSTNKTDTAPGYVSTINSNDWMKNNNMQSLDIDWHNHTSSSQIQLTDKHRHIDAHAVFDSITVSISLDKWGSIPIIPLSWYNEALVLTKGNNSNALRSGYLSHPSTNENSAHIFGKNGMLPARKTNFLVGYKATLKIKGIIKSPIAPLPEITNDSCIIKSGSFEMEGKITEIKRTNHTYSMVIENHSETPFIWGVLFHTFYDTCN